MQYTFSGQYHLTVNAAFFAIILAFTSCEKVVNVHLSPTPPALVVQGQIETGLPPVVILTTSISFFSKIDLTTLQNSFVHGATVTVSDGSRTMNLKEYYLDTLGTNKIYYYTLDTTNLGNIFVGQVEHFYTLTIIYNGKTYTSVTKIPNPAPIDTLYTGTPLFTDNKTPKNALQLFTDYSDPDTIGNYVKYFTSRDHQAYYPANNVFSDEVINGNKITQLGLQVGYNDSTNVNSDSLRYLYPGDTITVKWCSIDKGVYTFWNTYQFALNAVGNPFASPINVTSNISNGALGVWAGYGTYFKTLIVK